MPSLTLSFQVTQNNILPDLLKNTDLVVWQISPASQLSFQGSHFAYFQVKVLELWVGMSWWQHWWSVCKALGSATAENSPSHGEGHATAGRLCSLRMHGGGGGGGSSGVTERVSDDDRWLLYSKLAVTHHSMKRTLYATQCAPHSTSLGSAPYLPQLVLASRSLLLNSRWFFKPTLLDSHLPKVQVCIIPAPIWWLTTCS